MLQRSSYILIALSCLSILTACSPQDISTRGGVVSVVSPQSTGTVSGTNTDHIRTYTDTVSYHTPSRQGITSTRYSIGVDASGTIQQISTQMIAGDHEDSRYQVGFARTVGAKIIGKKLTDITSLDALGGASLTTDAFLQFIHTVKS